MSYDPIEDTKKTLTLREFVDLAKEELEAYAQEWEGTNDFHKQPHTWREWFNAFHQYMSW